MVVDQTERVAARAPTGEERTLPSGDLKASGARVVPERGEMIGRFLVVAQLGAGAMGVVLAGYDAELDRKVALKLLRNEKVGRGAESERVRLQREAQALAKLSHPNVVGVHEVGEHQGRVFVAMEFVDGSTLGEWTRSEPRGWRDVLRIYLDAAGGLAAAHGAGLVHRDFKPDNVMIGDDGRVRVMDFGLARAGGPADGDPPGGARSGASEDRAADPLTRGLTRTGAIMGTPAYMSPEQFHGEVVTAASDQFSFCVSLYEALYGQRPFRGDTFTDLAAAVTRGNLAEPPAGRSVPSWLHKIVVRGLQTEVTDRWASMDALIGELSDDPADRRRWWAVGGAMVGLLGLASYGMLRAEAAEAGAEAEICSAADEELSTAWGDARSGELLAALQGRGESVGVIEARSRVLDDYAGKWVGTYETVCTRNARGQEAESHYAAKMRCLDQRRNELETLVSTFIATESADSEALESGVVRMPDPGVCDDLGTVEALFDEPPPAISVEAGRVGAEIDTAWALAKAGDSIKARPMSQSAVESAKRLRFNPLLSRALLVAAGVDLATGEFDAAAESAREARWVSVQLRDWDGAFQAGTDLADALMQSGSAEVASEVARDVEGLARRVGAWDNPEPRAWHLAKQSEIARELNLNDLEEQIQRELVGSEDTPPAARVLAARQLALSASGAAVEGRKLLRVRELADGAFEMLRVARSTASSAFSDGHPVFLQVQLNEAQVYGNLTQAFAQVVDDAPEAEVLVREYQARAHSFAEDWRASHADVAARYGDKLALEHTRAACSVSISALMGGLGLGDERMTSLSRSIARVNCEAAESELARTTGGARANLYLTLGTRHILNHSWGRATKLYTRALEDKVFERGYKRVQLLGNLAWVLIESGDRNAAQEALDEAVGLLDGVAQTSKARAAGAAAYVLSVAEKFDLEPERIAKQIAPFLPPQPQAPEAPEAPPQ